MRPCTSRTGELTYPALHSFAFSHVGNKQNSRRSDLNDHPIQTTARSPPTHTNSARSSLGARAVETSAFLRRQRTRSIQVSIAYPNKPVRRAFAFWQTAKPARLWNQPSFAGKRPSVAWSPMTEAAVGSLEPLPTSHPFLAPRDAPLQDYSPSAPEQCLRSRHKTCSRN